MVDIKKLRSYMVLAGYTQRDLARKLAITENSLCKKFQGKSSFSVDLAEEICAVLGITDAKEKAKIFFN